eukprot:gene27570-22821_t
MRLDIESDDGSDDGSGSEVEGTMPTETDSTAKAKAAPASSSTPWSCATCTFLHTDKAAMFLACFVCGAPKSISTSTSTTTSTSKTVRKVDRDPTDDDNGAGPADEGGHATPSTHLGAGAGAGACSAEGFECKKWLCLVVDCRHVNSDIMDFCIACEVAKG